MTMFGMQWRANFGKMIAWAIVLAILAGLMIAFFPLMQDESTKGIYDSFVTHLSPTLQQILGVNPDLKIDHMGEYLAFIYQYLGVLIAMFAMQLGASALSRDQETGVIEYLYQNPVSRSEIVSEKLGANVVLYLLFLVILAAATFGISIIFQPIDMRKQEILFAIAMIFVGLLGLGLVWMAVGFLISALANSHLFADALSVLLVLVGVVVQSVLYYIGYAEVANLGAFQGFLPLSLYRAAPNLLGIGVSVAVFVVCILLTYVIYGNKELKY